MAMRAIDKAFEVQVPNDGAGYGVYMEDDGDVHVIPEFGPKHERRAGCWCHPDIDLQYDAPLLIHNVAH